jgi:hypothetical protein
MFDALSTAILGYDCVSCVAPCVQPVAVGV